MLYYQRGGTGLREMDTEDISIYPSLEQAMEWKMIDGLQNTQENCPDKPISEITYQDSCSYAAYELGAWGHAYLQHLTAENQLIEVFYPALNEMEWEGSFVHAFVMTSADFYVEFNEFLEWPISEQLSILPDM
jgi:hypothetical protein